jgi:SNF2 family DNA or RNA helicase
MAMNEAIKVNKLTQIACGVAYASNGEDVVLPASNRLEVVKEIIEQSGGKVIVFVPFRSALERVAEFIGETWDVSIIHGGVTKRNRDEIFRGFQQEKSPHVIVAQPGTMSHGLTLTAASTIIWFAPIHSNEQFNQAIARITRPGQKLNQLIVMIEGTEIERRIYANLKSKTKLQGTLLKLLKEQT